MIPSSSLCRRSHPDFVNMDSEALNPNWCLTPLSTHHLGLLLCLKIHQICFLLQGIHIRTRFYTHNYKSFFLGGKKRSCTKITKLQLLLSCSPNLRNPCRKGVLAPGRGFLMEAAPGFYSLRPGPQSDKVPLGWWQPGDHPSSQN